MITRRSLFASLAGLAAPPAAAKQVIADDFGVGTTWYWFKPEQRLPEWHVDAEFMWLTPRRTLGEWLDDQRMIALYLSRPQRDKGQQ